MSVSKEDVWRKFYQWAKRYNKICEEIIDEMLCREDEDFEVTYKRELADHIADLQICKEIELGSDLILDHGVTKEVLYQRISYRIQLFIEYLADNPLKYTHFNSADCHKHLLEGDLLIKSEVSRNISCY